MKYTNIPAHYPIKAELCTSDSLCLRSEVPCDLSQEAVEYAALRFLAHNSRLYYYYASESCKLRFAKGKAARRPKTFRCTAPAFTNLFFQSRFNFYNRCFYIIEQSKVELFHFPAHFL